MISVQSRFPGGAGWIRALLMSTLLLPAFAPGSHALEDPATAAEVRALRQELTRVKAEVESLKQENTRLRNRLEGASPVSAPAASTVSAAAGSSPGTSAPAPTPVTSLTTATLTVPAPVAEGTALSVDQLLQDYRTSTLAGDARYKGRRIRLTGAVRSFKKTFVGLSWIVELQAGDALGLVRCTVGFPGLSDFRPSPGNRILEGRKPFRAWQKILESGETLTVEGEVIGVEGAVVVLKDCRPALRE